MENLNVVDIKEKDINFFRKFLKKIKPVKTRKDILNSYGFYITLILLIVSTVGIVIMWCTRIYDNIILKHLTLHEDGTFYNVWREPDFELVVRIYPFNYTNIDAVLAGKEKIRVEELGPYVFSEKTKKVNIEFNGTEYVTFTANRTLKFLKKLSNGSLSDSIITPNVVYIAAGDKVSKDRFQMVSLSLILSLFKSKPFIKVSVNEVLMGYDDNLSIMIRRINTLLRKEVPPPFGILSKRAGVSENNITIGTGIPDINNYGIITRDNKKEQLDKWDESKCNNITASDGFLFPSNLVSNSDTIHIYTKDLCRRLPLKAQKEYINEQGFPAKRFAITEDVYATPNINADNECFCKNGECISGVQNVAPCFYDAPFVMTHPHFLYGDKSLFENIDGLKPDPEKHTYFTDLHRDLGYPLRGHTRVQLGIIVNKDTILARSMKLNNGIIIPISWMDFALEGLTPSLINLIYHATFTASIIKNILRWGFLTLFSISLIPIIFYIYFLVRC